jgi:hypothetical protein
LYVVESGKLHACFFRLICCYDFQRFSHIFLDVHRLSQIFRDVSRLEKSPGNHGLTQKTQCHFSLGSPDPVAQDQVRLAEILKEYREALVDRNWDMGSHGLWVGHILWPGNMGTTYRTFGEMMVLPVVAQGSIGW